MRSDIRPMKRTLCIALHDVAPATWPRCERLLAMLDAIGARAITLLVVPDFHRHGAAERDAAFVAAIEARRERGDEIALHGYTHVDESAAPRTLSSWFRRRVLTDAEGEFSALDRIAATQRIAAGREMLARIQEDDEDVPFRKRGWWYSSRTLKGHQYPIYVRRQGSLSAPEEVIAAIRAFV